MKLYINFYAFKIVIYWLQEEENENMDEQNKSLWTDSEKNDTFEESFLSSNSVNSQVVKIKNKISIMLRKKFGLTFLDENLNQ